MKERDRAYTQKMLDRILAMNIPEANKTAIRNFYGFLAAREVSPRTVVLYLYALEKFLPALGNIGLADTKREDIEQAFCKIGALPLADRTKRDIKANIKCFFKHTLGEDEFYPKQIMWLKTAKSRKSVLPQDMLTENDIKLMLEACNNIRDKAIIALLYDSGVRIGELLSIRKKDVDFATTPAHIMVNGKVGMRRIPALLSAPYMAQYLDSRKDLGPEDIIWRTQGSFINVNNELSHHAVRTVLKRMAKKAGIQKPRMRPHLFRHSRATNLANKLTEQQLKLFMGWTKDSNMAGIYVHLSGRDIDDAFMKANGVELEQQTQEPQLKIRLCPKCRFSNGMESSYCSKCGSAMTMEMALAQQQDIKNGTDALEALLQSEDPKKLKERLSRLILTLDYEQKKNR